MEGIVPTDDDRFEVMENGDLSIKVSTTRTFDEQLVYLFKDAYVKKRWASGSSFLITGLAIGYDAVVAPFDKPIAGHFELSCICVPCGTWAVHIVSQTLFAASIKQQHSSLIVVNDFS